MKIRPATADDADAISRLIVGLAHLGTADPSGAGAEPFFATLTPEATRKRLEDANFRYWVTEVEKRIVAAICMRGVSHLYHLFVDEAFQRRGIAAKLWRLARHGAEEQGHRGSFTVNSSMHAVPVYERFGFRATAEPIVQDGIVFVPMELPTKNL